MADCCFRVWRLRPAGCGPVNSRLGKRRVGIAKGGAHLTFLQCWLVELRSGNVWNERPRGRRAAFTPLRRTQGLVQTNGAGRWTLKRRKRRAPAASRRFSRGPYFGVRVSRTTAPPGLRPPAQGCEERATLGASGVARPNPNRGCGPPAVGAATTPLGLGTLSTRPPRVARSARATLGWRTQPRWG